jgi:hypothetical protein
VVAALASGALGCGLAANGLDDVGLDGSVGSAGTLDGSLLDGPHAPSDGASTGADATPASADATLSSEDASGPPDDAIAPEDVHILSPDGSYAEGGDACDLDQDGYRAESCGGSDCCDYDSRATPGDNAYYGAADACGSFDYDCDGTLEPRYAKVSCQLGFFVCTGSGFDQAPPLCGDSATYDTCNDALVTCTTTQSSVAQECR